MKFPFYLRDFVKKKKVQRILEPEESGRLPF